MPTIQWVKPYLDYDSLPPVGSDWGQINIINISDRGWSQRGTQSYDNDTGIISQNYDVQRIYTVQIDFYGPNAYDNAVTFKQHLQVGLSTEYGIADLKSISDIRNLTELLENTNYLARYEFDVDIFVVDTITKQVPAIETATVTIVNRGINTELNITNTEQP